MFAQHGVGETGNDIFSSSSAKINDKKLILKQTLRASVLSVRPPIIDTINCSEITCKWILNRRNLVERKLILEERGRSGGEGRGREERKSERQFDVIPSRFFLFYFLPFLFLFFTYLFIYIFIFFTDRKFKDRLGGESKWIKFITIIRETWK